MEDIHIHALATAFIERYSKTHAWDKDMVLQKEAYAAADAKFKQLLAGVWKNLMSDEVWERVCRCRGEPW